MTERMHVSQHALVRVLLTQLRDKDTKPPEFRRLVKQITTLLLYEVTQDLAMTVCGVQTPLAEAEGAHLRLSSAIVPILRAGDAEREVFSDFLPDAPIWHFGVSRNEQTLRPRTYLDGIPKDRNVHTAYVLDIMIATGGSAVAAMDVLVQRKAAERLVLVGLLAAPEGIKRVHEQHPDADIFVAAVDQRLTDNGFIFPGLGDAGDRLNGTR